MGCSGGQGREGHHVVHLGAEAYAFADLVVVVRRHMGHHALAVLQLQRQQEFGAAEGLAFDLRAHRAGVVMHDVVDGQQHVAVALWRVGAGQSVLLTLGVGLGVVLLGTATAAAVSLFDLPRRRHSERALLLPLAMPAYGLAYAWNDTLQFSVPLQSGLRNLLGLRAVLSERSV